MNLRLPATALAALLIPLSTAHAHEDGGDPARVIRVLLGEMYFQVEGRDRTEPLVLPAGETVTLAFENEGRLQHEILLGRDVRYEDGQPDDYRTNFFDDMEVELEGHAEGGGEFVAEVEGLEELYLDPGTELEVTFTVPEGRTGAWELGCFLPGHYQAGMKLPVQVE